MTRKRLSLSELLESEEDLLVLIGAEDDEDGGADQDDQDENEDGDASGEDGDNSTDEDDEDGDEDEDDEDVPGLKARITALEKEKDRHFRKAAREKKRADGLQAQLDAKAPAGKKEESKDEDKDSSESTRVTAVNEALAIQNAFLMANTKHEFVNTKAALKLLDVSDLDIEEDGTVDGMDEAIEALAKDHPYLLKKKAAPAARRTGDKPSSTTKNSEKSAAAKKRELEDRYPALRNR